MDIAAVSENADLLFVHLGVGDGTFTAPVSYPTNDLPSRVDAADYDRDGRLDLLVIESGNKSVSLFLGTAGGGFTRQGSYAMPASTVNGVVSTDYDGDGFIDLLAAGSDWMNTISISSNFMGATRAPVVEATGWSVDALTVTIRFDLPINAASLSLSDLLVTNLTTGGAAVAGGLSLSDDGRQATFRFLPSLADGLLRFHLAGGAVTGRNGVALASGVTLEGDAIAFMRGDLNNDHQVNFADLLILAQNYDQAGRSYSQGNVDYSTEGLVGFDDLLILSQRYGATLVTSAPTLAARKKRVSAVPGLAALC